ncbi:MAG: addiction module protein [Elusimicrobiota bacterium]
MSTGQVLTATDVISLSIPERIQLAEDIWDTVAANADLVELTEDEKKVIDKRLEAYYQNPALGSSSEDVFRRIASKK